MAGNSNSGQHLIGNKPPSSGRQMGQKNYKTIMIDELMTITGFKEKLEDGTFVTPAVFWATIMNDPTKDDNIKQECAKAMAPFLYRKQPQVLENIHSVDDSNTTGITMTVIKNATQS